MFKLLNTCLKLRTLDGGTVPTPVWQPFFQCCVAYYYFFLLLLLFSFFFCFSLSTICCFWFQTQYFCSHSLLQHFIFPSLSLSLWRWDKWHLWRYLLRLRIVSGVSCFVSAGIQCIFIYFLLPLLWFWRFFFFSLSLSLASVLSFAFKAIILDKYLLPF